MLLIISLGLLSLIFVVLTAAVGGMILKGKTKLTIKNHKLLAIISILFLVLHVMLIIIWFNQ